MSSQSAKDRKSPSGPVVDPVEQFVIRQGTATAEEGLNIAVPIGNTTPFPKNGAGDPLEVRFPGFSIGNVLEVEAFLSGGGNAGASSRADMNPLISIDGGATFYLAFPAEADARVVVDSFSGFSLSAYFNILIQDPMPIYAQGTAAPILMAPVTAPPIIRLRNLSNFIIQVQGNGPPVGAGQLGELWLAARELNPKLIFQGPQGKLAVIPPI